MSDYTDKYKVEVELKTVNDEGKHPVQTVNMTKISHADFMKVKRDPEVKDTLKKLVSMGGSLKELSEKEKPTPEDKAEFKETVDMLLESAMLADDLLELASVVFIGLQHPGLLNTLSKKGGGDLVNAVIENDIKEAFGMGEAIKALGEMTTEPESPTPSTTTPSTPSSGTTSSSEQDGGIDKS